MRNSKKHLPPPSAYGRFWSCRVASVYSVPCLPTAGADIGINQALGGHNSSKSNNIFPRRMNQRIIGFDLARAYAIFGMFVVNFTFCFGSFRNPTVLGKLTNLFIGNSTSIFIICAGMGIVLLANRHTVGSEEKKKLKRVILKRSLFLLGLGLLLYNWWPGDILHFYGAYLDIAAFLLFVPKRYYLWAAASAIAFYFVLQLFIPITTSWNLQTTQYADFWTPAGFVRNTFYNGWNAIFPWFAYFALGMYLGRLDWQDKATRKRVFTTGFCLLAAFKALRLFIGYDFHTPERNWFYSKYWFQLMEDYFPVNIPFIMITSGWALMVISSCMYLGEKLSASRLIDALAKTGQMTLSHYVIHMTAGILLLSVVTKIKYTGFPQAGTTLEPSFILIYAILFFAASVLFSYLWSQRFKNGPLEALMRHVSDK